MILISICTICISIICIGKSDPQYFVSLQITASDQTRVVIDDVQINHSGMYMCEVTVSPTYSALIQFANMTVVGK